MQKSVTVRNAQLDALETAIGTTPLLRLYTGTIPANCAAARTGTLLAEMTLPSDWLAAASAGSKSKSGTWQDFAANAAGTIGYWSIHDSGGTNCHLQGSVSATGGGGEITFDNLVVALGQQIDITAFALTGGGA
jgi:hypothetical protein